MRFTLGALVDRVSGMFVPLGASHTGLQLIVVGLQFPEFLLMATFHLCDAGLELAKSITVCHCREKGIGNWIGSRLRSDHVLTISAGGHSGSFIVAPWWTLNVLTEIWSKLTSR